MKMKKTMVWMAATAVMVASTHAALITFSGPVDASNSSVLDVYAASDLVQAANIGTGAQTVTTAGGQTINFTAMTTALGNVDVPVAIPSETTGTYNGSFQNEPNCFTGTTDSTAWTAVLQGNAWHNNASDAARPLTLHLAGLTSGQEYAVVLFTADARQTDRSQAYWSGFSGGTFSGGTSGSFSQTSAFAVTGTFEADATSQDIFIQETDGIDNADTTLSAYTLYAVPEPATLGLVGLFGAGLFFVRRRLMH